MRTTTKAKVGLASLGVLGLSLATTLPAYADYQPGPNDVVGVGGDTPQFDLQFGADGDIAGDPGYNTVHNVNKLVTFNATADANGRAGYVNGTSTNLNPTDVLRAGTSPVTRISSSGNAINALLADKTKPYKINFVFTASEPTLLQQQTAEATGAGADNFGFLHVVQLGTDKVVIAAEPDGNAPETLTRAQLLYIYTTNHTVHWNDIPDAPAGASSDAIVPELPPSSSSIYKTFIADLTTENSNTPITLSNPDIKTVEQNDPSAITGASSPADAIVPFSSARLKLDKANYFGNPASPYPGTIAATPDVAALTTYSSPPVNHYVIFRQSDANSTAVFQPGSSLNWVNTLFAKSDPTNDALPTPFFESGAGQTDIAAAGTTPAYDDLGNVNSG